MANYSTKVCFIFLTLSLFSSLASAVTVSLDGLGDYSTIGEAIAEAPTYSDSKYVINIRPGIYEEHLTIPRHKPNVVLVGDGHHNTKIVGHDHTTTGPLFLTATVAIEGVGFVGQGIGFVNYAGPTAGPGIAVVNTGDESAFFKCSFEGFQDTLWASSGRQFYRECDIYGSVDFIMGNAAAVFQNCMLYARLTGSVVFTAQSRDSPMQRTGFVFQYCRFTVSPEEELSGAGKATLGRPWRAFSRVVIMRSYIDAIVSPRGWSVMDGIPTDHATYIEFENEGPGSSTRGRVGWPVVREVHDKKLVSHFTVSRFLDGDAWIPQTGVPYLGGLS